MQAAGEEREPPPRIAPLAGGPDGYRLPPALWVGGLTALVAAMVYAFAGR